MWITEYALREFNHTVPTVPSLFVSWSYTSDFQTDSMISLQSVGQLILRMLCLYIKKQSFYIVFLSLHVYLTVNNYNHCTSRYSWLQYFEFGFLRPHAKFISCRSSTTFQKASFVFIVIDNFSNLFRFCVTVFALFVNHLKVKLPLYKAGRPPAEVARLL